MPTMDGNIPISAVTKGSAKKPPPRALPAITATPSLTPMPFSIGASGRAAHGTIRYLPLYRRGEGRRKHRWKGDLIELLLFQGAKFRWNGRFGRLKAKRKRICTPRRAFKRIAGTCWERCTWSSYLIYHDISWCIWIAILCLSIRRSHGCPVISFQHPFSLFCKTLG